MIISKQIRSRSVMILLQGTESDCEAKLTSFFNWGLLDYRRTVVHRCSAGAVVSIWFATTEESLLDYFIALASLAFDPDRLDSMPLQAYLRAQAQSVYDALPLTRFGLPATRYASAMDKAGCDKAKAEIATLANDYARLSAENGLHRLAMVRCNELETA